MSLDRTSIVVGSRGQDGTLLSRNLMDRGIRVIGIGRSVTTLNEHPLELAIDIRSASAVAHLVEEWNPSEVYYLAAHHNSSEDFSLGESTDELYRRSQEIHVTCLVNFLSAIAKSSPSTKLFYAGSSLIFGRNGEDGQDETTAYDPDGVYGITKAQGLWMCREYRNKHGVYACGGILYNHESHLRPATFLTSKVIQTAHRIASGSIERLKIGSLSARVDWGLAKDYVGAFEAILRIENPGDYIIATGVLHSVEEFIASVFHYFRLDWRRHVDINPEILSRQRSSARAIPAKLERDTGIILARPLQELVDVLIRDHITAKSNP